MRQRLGGAARRRRRSGPRVTPAPPRHPTRGHGGCGYGTPAKILLAVGVSLGVGGVVGKILVWWLGEARTRGSEVRWRVAR